MDRDIPLTDRDAAAEVARNLDVSHLEDDSRLRGAAMGEAASVVSAYQPVRDALLAFQRQFGAQEPGAVLDGRDIGTGGLPRGRGEALHYRGPRGAGAAAPPGVAEPGEQAEYETILVDIRRRDERDMNRSTAPLKAAADAMTLDTTHLDADSAFLAAVDLVEGRRP